MFAIRLLPPADLDPDGQRVGEIVVGDFRETFACPHAAGFAGHWREQLAALVGGEPAVVLRHDPRVAWIVYRDGTDCFVQQWLSVNGESVSIPPRATVNEDGQPVSEWPTTIAAIRRFLIDPR